MKPLRYPPRALLGDYLRSAAGLIAGGGVLLAVPPTPVVVAIFGSIAALFAVFGLRTAHRHALRIAVSDTAIACRGATTKVIAWDEIVAVKLRYFGSRRTKWRPLGSGFMQLTLKGPGRGLGATMTFESSLEGFDWLAGRAAAAMRARGLSLDPATASNLVELGIDPQAPSDGCDSPTNVL
ncbi:MAG: hypothetical protein ACFB13_07570 [Kiloniellaceae bacterium]